MSSEVRTALITGATGAIGRALVRVFKESGFRVIATDIVENPVDLDCTHYVPADLARYVQDDLYASDLNADLRRKLQGRLDVLINNAAIQILGGVDSLTREDWRTTLDVNLLAPFQLAQTLLPELENTKGNIVNVSSVHARLTKRNFVAYATSKAALSGMTRAMSVDLGPRIRVNAIEPAAIETDMLMEGFKEKPVLYTDLRSYHPVNRIGLPEEVAQTALWLVSDAAEFIHGGCIRLDGGISNCLHDPC